MSGKGQARVVQVSVPDTDTTLTLECVCFIEHISALISHSKIQQSMFTVTNDYPKEANTVTM